MTPHQNLGREGVNRTLVVGTKIQRPAIERPRAGAAGRTRTPVVPGRNGMHKSALPRAHFDSGARCWSRTNLTGLIRAVPHRWVKRAKTKLWRTHSCVPYRDSSRYVQVFEYPRYRRREESRRGTHECVRYKLVPG